MTDMMQFGTAAAWRAALGLLAVQLRSARCPRTIPAVAIPAGTFPILSTGHGL